MASEIDCKYTNEIVCPYCGYKFHDSWEYGGRDECFEVECGECEKPFDVYRDVSVTYCSTRQELPDQGETDED